MSVQKEKIGVVVFALALSLGPCMSAVAARSGGTIGAAERVRLRTIALSHAGLFGDPHPTNLEAVRTTYAKYRRHLSAPPRTLVKLRHAGTFYVVEMEGKFRVPNGETNEPSFPDIEVFVSLKNARIAGLFLPRHRSLSVLGTVARL